MHFSEILMAMFVIQIFLFVIHTRQDSKIVKVEISSIVKILKIFFTIGCFGNVAIMLLSIIFYLTLNIG